MITLLFKDIKGRVIANAAFIWHDLKEDRFFISARLLLAAEKGSLRASLCANMPIVMQSPVDAEGW